METNISQQPHHEETTSDEGSVVGWCHTCCDDVRARTDQASGELECSRCHGFFVEATGGLTSDESLLDFLTASNESAGPSGVNRGGGDNRRPEGPAPDLVAGAVQQILAQVLGGGRPASGVELLGALQPLFTNGGGATGGGDAFGDYAIGNLSNIIEQLVANDASLHPRARPASKEGMERLCTNIDIQQKHVDDGWECAIQKECFAIGETATRLPCGHIFLDAAIGTWLSANHSCPVCRHELPTDDEIIAESPLSPNDLAAAAATSPETVQALAALTQAVAETTSAGGGSAPLARRPDPSS